MIRSSSIFPDDKTRVTNLIIYRDYSALKQSINYYMYSKMKKGEKRLTKDNYYDTLLNMFGYAMNYDYNSIFN